MTYEETRRAKVAADIGEERTNRLEAIFKEFKTKGFSKITGTEESQKHVNDLLYDLAAKKEHSERTQDGEFALAWCGDGTEEANDANE
jgi:hypothetical protein